MKDDPLVEQKQLWYSFMGNTHQLRISSFDLV